LDGEMNLADLTEDEQALLGAVSRFRRGAGARRNPAIWSRPGEYPQALVDEMKALGLFGMAVPEAFGGLGLRTTRFAADDGGSGPRLDHAGRLCQQPQHRGLCDQHLWHRQSRRRASFPVWPAANTAARFA
jgi:hypothetical protein